jgi:hypothetical protein
MAACAAMAACATQEGTPSATPPGAGATECADAVAWADELRGLPVGALIAVEPKYFVDTCSGTTKVAGTRLIVRDAPLAAPEGTGPPTRPGRLGRLLRCSSARVHVGPTPEPATGLWLPAGWIDIDVQAQGGAFAVTLSADSVSKNIELLRRAAEAQGETQLVRGGRRL